jgi:hypothetical protein
MRVTDKELREASEEERAKKLKALVEATKRLSDEDVRQLDDEITAYEKKYGITSEEMQTQLNAGTREETLEICEWLMLIRRFEVLIGTRVTDMLQV